MRRRLAYGALALGFTGIVATTIVRCDLVFGPFTDFSYIPRERPRVFVSHHPIRALPGAKVTISLAPDLRPEDGPVASATAGLRRLSTDTRDELTCAPVGPRFECQFTLPAGAGDYIYDGFLELASGTRVDAFATYRFRAASAIGATEMLTLREPVKTLDELEDSYRVDTAWLGDFGDPYGLDQFFSDIEAVVYDGLLADPVFRWRDRQLAFYVYGGTGFTSSYYSGLNTRCGQNPWPAEAAIPAAFAPIEVIGVLHRHPSAGSGVEGSVAPGADLKNVFRDCAGTAVKSGTIRTFSTRAGIAESARIAKHEYGHAAFGLGDEYVEPDATRQVNPAIIDPTAPGCCCFVEVMGGIEPPGTKQRQCLNGGAVVPMPGPTDGLPPCESATFAPSCYAQPQGGCPLLGGNCVQASAWLGVSPPGGTARSNVFTTEAACTADRARAVDHPGVEDAASSLGATCRQICGGGVGSCPCGQAEAWIVDLNPASALPPPTADSMAAVAAERDGATCAWCVDTTLCVRWQRAQGDTVDDAWSTCDKPPANSADLERQRPALIAAIVKWIRDHLVF